MKIFISGPYASPDPCENVRNAILAAEDVIKFGHVPFIPHLNHIWHLISPHSRCFWLEYDIQWLKSCNAILRLPGESPGADNEVRYAIDHKIAVFYKIEDLDHWDGLR